MQPRDRDYWMDAEIRHTHINTILFTQMFLALVPIERKTL